MKRFSEVFKNKVAELDEVRCSEDVIIHFLDEEQDDETTANLLKSLREAADAWLKENPNGLDL